MSVTKATQSALRYARNLARAEGVILRPFKMIAGTDESSLGPEWIAWGICRENEGDNATVFLPLSEIALNECLRTCTVCRSFGGRIYGISIHTKHHR